MTVTDLPRTAGLTHTPESLRLAQIVMDLAAIEAKMVDPQGWGRLLEDQRSALLSERADLLKAGAQFVATTVRRA